MGNGVGFTFGWVPDGTANESETLEGNATATWTTSALTAGTYTVYADYDLTDAEGNTGATLIRPPSTRLRIRAARPRLPPTRARPSMAQLDLGLVTTTGPGQVTVQLLRQSTAKPSQWTLANQVEFVGTDVDLKVGSPSLPPSPPPAASRRWRPGLMCSW